MSMEKLDALRQIVHFSVINVAVKVSPNNSYRYGFGLYSDDYEKMQPTYSTSDYLAATAYAHGVAAGTAHGAKPIGELKEGGQCILTN